MMCIARKCNRFRIDKQEYLYIVNLSGLCHRHGTWVVLASLATLPVCPGFELHHNIFISSKEGQQVG